MDIVFCVRKKYIDPLKASLVFIEWVSMVVNLLSIYQSVNVNLPLYIAVTPSDNDYFLVVIALR